MQGVYVHIPFCRRKCLYCDFYSVGVRIADWRGYVEAIVNEWETRGRNVSPNTIYIGGGTPSLIPEDDFQTLTGALISTGNRKPEEITLEVNPDDVAASKIAVWKNSGINRISMGVQSLVDSELRAVGRRHDSASAINAYDMLRKEFPNISLDVIFGLPGQTVGSWHETLSGIIAMRPEHISAYSLMYEERTALTRMRDCGKLTETREEDSETMFRMLCAMLEEAGYEHYELSNFALPGFRSKHNSGYWNGMPYIGLGAGAHSYDGENIRRANIPDFRKYTDYWLHGKDEEPWEEEKLTTEDLRHEMIMTRLRTREGLDLAYFAKRFGENELGELLRGARKWVDAGRMSETGNHLALTRDGILVSDEIIAELF